MFITSTAVALAFFFLCSLNIAPLPNGRIKRMNKYRLGLVLVVIALLAGSGAVSAQPAPASVPVTIDQQLWAEMLREFGEIPLTDRQRALVHALLQNVQREAQAREARAKDEAKPKAAENPKP